MRRLPSEAVYALLLRALPGTFRRAYGAEMSTWFREHRRRIADEGGALSWLRFWSVILADLVRTMFREHASALAERLHHLPRQGHALMNGFLHDTRVAIRAVTRRPGFFSMAVITLALGVGFATTVYTAVHSVLLAPLPYENPGRIFRVGKLVDGRAGVLSVSALDFQDLQERNRSFEALAASRPGSMVLTGTGEAELLHVAKVSAEFFDVLGRRPGVGRAWGPEDDLSGGSSVVVLGHSIWERRWGGDPDLVGRTITLSAERFTVIGIMPEGFVPPEALYQRSTEAWMPLAFLDEEARRQRSNQFLQLIGRSRSGVSQEVATEELRRLGAQISREHPGPGDRVFGLSPLHDETVGAIGDVMMPVLGGVLLLLIIACVNVANLLLIRGNERRKEMSVRAALGAGRWRLLRQLLTEGLVIGLLGGMLGAALSAVGVWAFQTFAPPEIPRLAEISTGAGVLLTSLSIAVGTSLVFGAIPALAAARGDLGTVLGHGSAGTGGSLSEGRLRDGLIGLETALAVVLVAGAGLLANSLLRLNAVELGFDPTGVKVVSVDHSDGSRDEITAFYRTVLERIASIPSVQYVGATDNLPLSGNRQMRRIRSPGLALSSEEEDLGGYPVHYQHVKARYFEAMGMRISSGRAIRSTEGAGAPAVVVVNRILADQMSPGGDAVGMQLTFSDDPEGTRPHRIVGVVENVRQQRLDAPGEPEIYLSFEQSPRSRMEIVAKASTDHAGILAAMREQIRAVRPDLPVRRAVDMTDFTAQSVGDRRFFALLLGSFAVLALTLAVVGIYGTFTFAVVQRRRELGVRLALGATGLSLVRTVFVRTMAILSIGVGIGTAISLFATRILETLLYGVTANDPLTLALTGATVLVVGVVASLGPAKRATELDPIASLGQS